MCTFFSQISWGSARGLRVVLGLFHRRGGSVIIEVRSALSGALVIVFRMEWCSGVFHGWPVVAVAGLAGMVRSALSFDGSPPGWSLSGGRGRYCLRVSLLLGSTGC